MKAEENDGNLCISSENDKEKLVLEAIIKKGGVKVTNHGVQHVVDGKKEYDSVHIFLRKE